MSFIHNNSNSKACTQNMMTSVEVNTEMSLKNIWFQQMTKSWHHKSTKPRNH